MGITSALQSLRPRAVSCFVDGTVTLVRGASGESQNRFVGLAWVLNRFGAGFVAKSKCLTPALAAVVVSR